MATFLYVYGWMLLAACIVCLRQGWSLSMTWKGAGANLKKLLDRPLVSPRLKNKPPIRVERVEHLVKHVEEDAYHVQDMDVRGSIHEILQKSNVVHPIVHLLHARKALGSARNDGKKIALAIEGGGMRGCVSAGMAAAISYLGLTDSFDAVYGSSAGAVVGAYLIANQFPYEGPEIYYNVLTSRVKSFLDKKNIFRSAGLGFLDLRLQSLIDLFDKRYGGPVLNLDYVCDEVIRKIQPLNWQVFWAKQETLPLHVIVSGLLSETSIPLSAAANDFSNIEELANCIKASMALPGITGPPVRLNAEQTRKSTNLSLYNWKNKLFRWKSEEPSLGSEPLADALLFEPLPYRSALQDNCTHVVVLRSRPDNISVTAKMSTIEKMIMRRFFGRKLKLPRIMRWMINQYHKLIYAEDILRINAENRDFESPQLYGIALPSGCKEVSRTDSDRALILQNVKMGFSAAYDALVPEPSMRGEGMRIANEIWPASVGEQ